MTKFSLRFLVSLNLIFLLRVSKFCSARSKSIEEKLLDQFEILKTGANERCKEVDEINTKHLNDGIDECAIPYLDNPPFPIPKKYYPKLYKKVKAQCWDTIKNFCAEGAIDNGLRCTIPKVIMYVKDVKKIYDKNKQAVSDVVHKVIPCALHFMKTKIS